MNCRRRKGSVSPNAHKKADPKRAGNGTQKYEDKHGMERRQRDPDPEWEGSGKVAKWS